MDWKIVALAFCAYGVGFLSGVGVALRFGRKSGLLEAQRIARSHQFRSPGEAEDIAEDIGDLLERKEKPL